MDERTCTVEGCTRIGRLKGKWCHMHYNRWKRTGNPLVKGKPGRPRIPDEVRFWPNVQKSEDGCWVWTAGLSSGGYGNFRSGNRDVPAHRWSYEAALGPIPKGLDLDHLCHTHDPDCEGGDDCPHRRCVNPEHLEPVTRRENILRGLSIQARNAAKTHCDKGHPFDEGNTVYRGGSRSCYTCSLMRGRRSELRSKEQP